MASQTPTCGNHEKAWCLATPITIRCSLRPERLSPHRPPVSLVARDCVSRLGKADNGIAGRHFLLARQHRMLVGLVVASESHEREVVEEERNPFGAER